MKIKKVPTVQNGSTTTILLPNRASWQVAKGHQPHRGGAGIHAGNGRRKTRQAQLRAALED